jgi:1-acyl-sn-glycerol-3-phosphate acyltransferase
MVRLLITNVLKFALRIYFKRIEVTGLEHVPTKSPVIFVLNHPNALVDPVFLLCLTPRKVSFLAKAPLFRMPVLGQLIKAMDALPVYRQQDQGADVTKNEETFVAARTLLASGGTIGICPEGVSHNAPGLRPIKTGAARIALASVSTGEVPDLQIVPAGLYYTSKTHFRSSALLYFGNAIPVKPVVLEHDGTPPRDAVRELSNRVERALREVILDAQHEEALHTISRAERIFTAETPEEETLTEELELQQRFIKAYGVLQERAPERLRRLEVRMSRFEEELRQAGVNPDDLSPPRSTIAVFQQVLKRSIVFLLMLAPAALGTVVHYPAYFFGGYLATNFSRKFEDMISTIKIMSAMLLFPLTWFLVAAISYELLGWLAAAISLIVVPLCGYVAVLFFEEFDQSLGGLRALAFFLVRRKFFIRLLAERKAIKNEILSLGKETVAAAE